MSSNKQWIRVMAVQNIPLREGPSVNVAGREIAIFNLGGRFLALDGRCPHKDGPLAEGIVTGTTVLCPLHARKINLESGKVAKPDANPPCVTTYRTRVDSDIIFIELPEQAMEKLGSHLFCDARGWPQSSDPASNSAA